MVHAVRAAMYSLKKTGTDFTSAQGMDPKAFFGVMGQLNPYHIIIHKAHWSKFKGLNDIIDLDARAGGSAFQHI